MIASGIKSSAQCGHCFVFSLIVATVCDGVTSLLLPFFEFFLGQALLGHLLWFDRCVSGRVHRQLESEARRQGGDHVALRRFFHPARYLNLVLLAETATPGCLANWLTTGGAQLRIQYSAIAKSAYFSGAANCFGAVGAFFVRLEGHGAPPLSDPSLILSTGA